VTFAVHRAGSTDERDPLLLLVHGLGGSHRSWTPLLPHLERDHRLLLLDLPGHGDAEPTRAADMTPAALGAELAALTRTLDTPTLVGHSLGGWVCLEAAAQVEVGVVAVTPAGLWQTPRRRPPLLPTGQQFARWAAHLPAGLVTSGVGRTLAMGATSTAPRRLPPELVRTAVTTIAAAQGYRDADAGIAANAFTRAADVLGAVTIVVGGRDRILPTGYRDRTKAPPQTLWIEWPDAGHVPAWDRPAECAQVIRRHLGRN